MKKMVQGAIKSLFEVENFCNFAMQISRPLFE